VDTHIIDDQVIGPVILQYHLTGQTYLEFLQSTLAGLVGDVPSAKRARKYLQHDGGPPRISSGDTTPK
jgi:hypothetical protein